MNSRTGKTVRKTAAEETVERIRHLILTGQLGPGEPLRQDELSAQLGVSRTPLREAIIRLQEQGLVVNHPHRGAVVFKPTAREMSEIYDLRMVLEPRLVRSAVHNLTEEDFEHLDELIDRMEAARTRIEYHALNNAFHLHIYSRASEPITIEILKMLRDKAAPYIILSLLAPSAMQASKKNSEEDHRLLLKALRARDVERAEKLTITHLAQTTDFYKSSLDNDIAVSVPAAPQPSTVRTGKKQRGASPEAVLSD